jgi:hypothetical protein
MHSARHKLTHFIKSTAINLHFLSQTHTPLLLLSRPSPRLIFYCSSLIDAKRTIAKQRARKQQLHNIKITVVNLSAIKCARSERQLKFISSHFRLRATVFFFASHRVCSCMLLPFQDRLIKRVVCTFRGAGEINPKMTARHLTNSLPSIRLGSKLLLLPHSR